MAKVATSTIPMSKLISTVFWLFARASLFLAATISHGADLITKPIDPAKLSALPHHIPAWASAENDIGEVADDLQLSHLTLVLKRTPQQQLAFEQFLAQQQDPNSPNFHHWLTPVQVGEQFGASAHDLDAVTQWLQSQGLHVDSVANSRTRIDFSGSATQVGAAFATRLHAYVVNEEQRVAPANAPRIPAALSPVVASAHGLTTTDEHPLHHRGTSQPVGRALPEETSCSNGTCIQFVYPADFATIYNANPVYQQGILGSGQSIAIVGRASVYLPDIENFQKLSGLPIKAPTILIPSNGIDPGPPLSTGGTEPADGDQFEATIDVTRAGSVAPGATIILVISANSATTGGIEIASQAIIDGNPLSVQILSISFGGCETNAGLSGVTFWDDLFSQAATEGISVFVASGDSGATGCDKGFSTPPPSQNVSLSPSVECVSSHVTCVGGTEFADTANPSAYWSSTNSANGFGSAFGYIPEGGWNEPLNNTDNPQAAASGGGVSQYIATPPWQTGPGVPGTQGRYTPDVAFSASGHDSYLICFAADGHSCVTTFEGASGTSAAAPSMAGIAALLNQKIGSPQGNLNPRLYALAATPGNGVFHDVTVASSGVPGCDITVPSMCNNSTPGPTGLSGGLAGYMVGPGYDEVTGLGSIDVAQLLAQWPATATTANFSGLWWAAPAGSESGWGINFSHQGNIIFATWFTYDLTGQFWWLSMTANETSNNTFSGTLYQTKGPAFSAVPFNPALVTATPVGTGTLAFSDGNDGTFAYTVNGISQVKAITHQAFGPLPTCVWGAPPSLATNVSGLWWAAPAGVESGWGINFSQQGNIIFATWFTYNGDGTPAWLSVTANNTAPGVYSGTLYGTSGPPFDAVPFLPADVSASPYGTATFTFFNGNSGTFSYTVNTAGGAVSQTKSITQQVFAAPGTACK